MPPENFKKHVAIVFYTLVICVCVVLAFVLAGKLFLPFVLAWIAAMLLQPIISWTSKFLGISKKPVGVIILLILVGGLLFALFLLANRLVRELSGLAEFISENATSIVDKIKNSLSPIFDLFMDDNENQMEGMLGDLLKNAVGELSGTLTSFAASLVKRLPDTFLSVVIFVMATYYICVDFSFFSRKLYSMLPNKAARMLGNIRRNFLTTTLSYVRACLILLAITFIELSIAFSVMNIKYSLGIAALVAVLDFLPAIGVGTVLVPWAILCFLSGRSSVGIGLLITFAIVSMVRQIAEPRVIGSSLGLHPLVSLMAVYAGYKLAGFLGILIAPICAIVIWKILNIYLFKEQK